MYALKIKSTTNSPEMDFGTLLSLIHADSPKRPFAVSFPELEKTIGKTLVLWTESKDDLFAVLRGKKTSNFLIGNFEIGAPFEVDTHNVSTFEVFSRIRPKEEKGTMSYLARQKRRGAKIEISERSFTSSENRSPSLVIKSQTNNQVFPLFIKREKIKTTTLPTTENAEKRFCLKASTYGLGGIIPKI